MYNPADTHERVERKALHITLVGYYGAIYNDDIWKSLLETKNSSYRNHYTDKLTQ